jgi:hypothetical protein
MRGALRPMSLGEILDRTVQIYRSRFLAFVSITAIATTAMISLNIADRIWINVRTLIPAPRPPATWLVSILVWLGFAHIHSLINSIFAPALVRQTWSTVSETNDSVKGSLAYGMRRWRTFLGIAALRLALGPLAVEVATAAVIVGVGVATEKIAPKTPGGALTLMVMVEVLAGLFLGQWLMSCFSLAVAAATVEDLRGMAALRRSWALTRERRWPIQFTWIAIFVGYMTVAYTLQFVLQWGWTVSWRTWHFHFSRPAYDASFFALNIVLGSLMSPIFPIASTLLYYDQRIRKEGYDIERMMDAAGFSAPAVPSVAVAEDSAEAEVQPG